MKTRSLSLRSLVIFGVTLTVALFGAFFISGLASARGDDSEGQPLAPVYKTNEYGQTYGSEMGARTLDEVPDLISAYGTDGTLGYVRRDDLHPESPRSPEEALRLQAQLQAAGGVTIPLFESDGRTQIGQVRIDSPRGVER